MKIDNGSHKILFSRGNLYLDGVQIGGEGILPAKDILFEFNIDNKNIVNEPVEKDPSILEINVFDAIPAHDIGPGQK